MIKRPNKRERLAAQAAAAWDLAEIGYPLHAICGWMGLSANRVWQLLEMHQKTRRARR